MAHFQQALKLKPDYPDVHHNVATLLLAQGKLEEGLANYERALQLKPDYAEAHLGRALIWLQIGDFERGFTELEWRWRHNFYPPRPFSQPLWDGSHLAGRTILLHAEQGLGDTLQFIRYAPLVKERGGRVIVECQDVLARLLATCPGVDQVVVQGWPLPDFQTHSPILSLPRILQTTFATIPANVPYLSADPELTGYWRHLMGGANGYKIGLAWQGNPVQGNDRNRSFPVTHFESLARLDGVRLFSLQKAPGSEQLADLGERFSIADLGSRFRSFEDTAAALKNLDLIIAVDSVVAHCAGALGFPVWVLLPFAADWRWLTHRENSPWYPSMRLFRQPQPGGWDSVFARLVEELSKQLALARSPGGTEFRGWPSQTDIRKEVCDSEKELADSLRRAIQAQEQDEIEQAEAIYRQVLEKNPDNTTARNRLARICLASGRCDEALENYQKLLRLLPNQAALLNDKGIALTELGKLSEAISSFKQALNRNPHYGDVYNNLGLALAKEGLLEEAIVAFAQSLSLKPDNPEAYCNLGNVVLDLGRVEDAVANYRQSIRLKPNYAEAQMNLAMTWLLLGEFERGWLWYVWRWRMTGTASRDFVQPPWDGSALSGAKILLHAEQGLGDTLQFIRYAPLVKERGGFVIVECPGTLVPLLATCPGIDELIAYGTMPPAFDTHAPLMGLPRLFGTSMATIPAAIPYLSAACDLGEYWRRHLSEIGGFKVGAFWQGDPRHQKDRQRSIPLAAFGPLADVAGVQSCSLQKEPGTDQLACAAFPILDLASRFRNFADTAAALVNLDLVITVDSAVAHCAGALGVPVWVLLPYAPDWRWLLHREDSPWYPTMRLFRQEQPGDWEGVFRRVKAALEERLAARK